MANGHADLFKSRSFTRDLDPTESRQRRINENQRIRKERREDELQRTRSYDHKDSFEDFVIDVEMLEVNQDENSLIKSEWIKLLYSEADYDQLNATEKISRMIRKHPETTAEIIRLELVPRFFEFLKNQNNTYLQQKAVEVLIELTATKCGCFFPAEASDILGKVLKTAIDENVLEATLLLLSNFAGQTGGFREQFLTSPAWKTFLNFLTLFFSNTKKFKLVYNGASALSNLCYRAKKSQNFDNILMCLPILVRMIHHDDYDLIFWGCQALIDITEVLVQPVIDCGASSRLIELLGSYTLRKIKTKAIRVIGLITKGNEEQTQLMIKSGVLPALYELLHSDNKEILFRSCYAVANIASGTSEQMQCVLDCGFIPIFLKLLDHNDSEVQLEAAWGITNCISCTRTSEAQIKFLISSGVVEALSGKLDSKDNEILHLILRSLRGFLEFGKVEYCEAMQRCNVINRIQTLQESRCKNVAKYAKKIIKHFMRYLND